LVKLQGNKPKHRFAALKFALY